MTDGASPSGPSGQKNPSFRKTLFKALLPAVVIIAVAAVSLELVKWKLSGEAGAAALGEPPIQIDIGTVLPDLPLRTLDGKSTRASKLGAKVVLLNFWATWCEACMVEMPSIVKLYDLYKDKGFQLVAVNLDDTPQTAVPRVVKKLKMDFPIYSDPDGTLSNFFDVHAIPLSVVFDKNRKVLLIDGGERDWAAQDVRNQMNLWLAR